MGIIGGFKIAFMISFAGGVLFVLFGTVNALIFSGANTTVLVALLACLCRLGGTMAFNIGYISVPRLFPTKFQSTVYAIVNFSAHIVACLAPLVAEIPSPVPFVGFLAAIGVSVLFLKKLTHLEQDKVE